MIKKMLIVTSRRKLLEARLNDLIMTMYWDKKIVPRQYYKCLRKIVEIRKILKLERDSKR